MIQSCHIHISIQRISASVGIREKRAELRRRGRFNDRASSMDTPCLGCTAVDRVGDLPVTRTPNDVGTIYIAMCGLARRCRCNHDQHRYWRVERHRICPAWRITGYLGNVNTHYGGDQGCNASATGQELSGIMKLLYSKIELGEEMVAETHSSVIYLH